jgi:SAM-dependent methyltransferase
MSRSEDEPLLARVGGALKRRVQRFAGHAEPPAAHPLRAADVLDQTLRTAQVVGATGRFLDVGCGDGEHTAFVRNAGVFKTVIGIDMLPGPGQPGRLTGDYESWSFDEPFDVVWASHVLEHVPNVRSFLHKIHRDLREGGVLAINVPPLKQDITIGHVSLWTPGLLLLNLVKAGFDCSQAAICREGYNIGLVVQKKTCPPIKSFRPASKHSARPYLPAGLTWWQNEKTQVWYFNGDFERINWPEAGP